MATTVPRSVRYPALSHRNFRLIWIGLLVSNMGTWMQNVAQNWLIYKITGNDPLYLGWLGLSFALPMILVPPIGGAVADRVDRIKLLYVTQIGSGLLALLLAVLTATGSVRPFHILLISFAGSVLLAFDNPTRQALIPELVPRQDLLNAVSLNSATYTGAALVGPAIAGLLLNVLGADWMFALNAVSYLSVVYALWAMRDVPQHDDVPSDWREAVFGGFVYVWKHRLLLGLLTLSVLASLFGRSYQLLLPVFADDVWRSGTNGYGILLSAGGAGALLGAFAMASARSIERQGMVLLGSGIVLCLALAGFALSPLFWVGAVLLVVVGFMANVFTTMIATVLQLRVPRALRGRVISLYAITLIGIPSLGSLGIAAVARNLTGVASNLGARLLSLPLRILGVLRITNYLGTGAGAPRAITLGALILLLVLLSGAPVLQHVRAETPGDER